MINLLPGFPVSVREICNFINEFDNLKIYLSLKFFCIDGRFDVICSGSMLGVNYRKIESNSVGYKKDYEMFS